MRLLVGKLLFAALFLPRLVHAFNLGVEFAGYYGSDSFANSTTSSLNRQFFQGGFVAPLDNKSRLFAGFQVISWSQSEIANSNVTFSSLDMGPYLLWAIDQKGVYTVSLAYNVTSQANFNDGTEKQWAGTGYTAALGVMPEVGDDFFVGFRLYYHAATYTQQTEGATASTISASRSWMMPAFSLSWRH